jgi:Tol biopolymer transport system component/DNA-binding winged helix-turn-helix (wHTH) protein
VTNRPVYEFGNARLDPTRMTLIVAGRPVALEPKSFDVLMFLVEHRDRLIGKDELLETVWIDTFVTPNVLTRAVAQLRKALGDDVREPRYIETVAKRGYRFIAPVVTLPPGRADGHATKPPPAWTASSPPTPPAAVKRSWRRATSLRALAVVALGAAVGAVAYRMAPRSRVEGIVPPVLERVTTDSGNDFGPAISPDARSIAYVSDRTRHLEIYVAALAPGSLDVPITDDGGENVEPAWSPDGRWLAFHSRKRDGIWIVPATGGTPQQIVEFGSHPAWAPDGERLVFSSYIGGMATQSVLWIVRRDGTGRAQLTKLGNPSGGHRMPSWSRDGRWIVYGVSSGKLLTDLWVISARDGSAHRLASFGSIVDPRFGPGDRFIYWGGALAQWTPAIARLPFDQAAGRAAGPVQTVEPLAGGTVSGLTIARDGTTVLSLSTRDANIWAVDVAADGGAEGPPVRLTDNIVRNTTPTYSPDGRLAYTQVAQTMTTWTMRDDGSGNRPLLTDAETISAGWARDGTRLLVLRAMGDAGRFAWVDAATRRVTPVALAPNGMASPRLSPDDREVAFHVIGADGAMNVWRGTLDGSRRRAVTHDEEAISYPSWSPDGRWLAVEVKRGDRTQVGVVPSEGGRLEFLTDAAGQSWPNDWAPDNDRIVFAGQRDGIWNLYTVSRRTKTLRQMTGFTSPSGYVRWPVWSPRGSRIAFERSIETASVWRTKLP